jgi:hypothetical protein
MADCYKPKQTIVVSDGPVYIDGKLLVYAVEPVWLNALSNKRVIHVASKKPLLQGSVVKIAYNGHDGTVTPYDLYNRPTTKR